VKKVEDLFIRT